MAEAAGKDVVVVAGGLGLAPLRPALYHLFAERDRYGEITLLYGTRSPDDILFRHEIESWRRRLDIDIEVTVDHALADWHGHVGVVPRLIPRASFDPERSVALVCGPEVMMRFTIAALRDAGLGDDAIYLSMERNMKCAIGLCGHCQFSPVFVCRDGPVFRYDRVRDLLGAEGALRWRRKGKSPGLRSGSSPPATAASSACSIARTSCSPSRTRSRSPISRRRRAAACRDATTSRWSKARSPRRMTPSASARCGGARRR